MKKLLLPILTFATLAVASGNNTVQNDPFTQMDKIFQMQMKQMELMQKQMDEMFKAMEKSSFANSNMPVVFSSGGMFSSGLKDKKDHYEVALKVGKNKNTKVDLKTKDGILSIKVEQSNKVDKNSSNGVFKSFSSSSYMQSFTLPKDANVDKIDYTSKDGEIIVTIPKKK